MFRFLQWILIFGAFAGLGLRASGAHFDDCRPDSHEAGCCGSEVPAAGHADDHGPDCPPLPHQHQGDHHHGECCHAPSWLSAMAAGEALFPPFARAIGLEEVRQHPPEGPVLPFDKPPLI